MTNEKRYVLEPLKNWFGRQKPEWQLKEPNYDRSETGWDLEARRKNQDLLIEAKFINGSFLGSFTALVTAPLAKRPQRFMKKKYRSWSHGICWAIGTRYQLQNIYQILFDYFARNLIFWRHYGQDLHMKYIFFVKDNKVAKILFDDMLEKASIYERKTKDKALTEKRKIAEELMEGLKYA